MNHMEDIDKVMLEKLGGHSEEAPAGLFESVMFQREQHLRSLKTKRILLITGAVILLAITAYVLYKNVLSVELPGQNTQPIATQSQGVHSENAVAQMNMLNTWPDYRMHSMHNSFTDNAANHHNIFISDLSYTTGSGAAQKHAAYSPTSVSNIPHQKSHWENVLSKSTAAKKPATKTTSSVKTPDMLRAMYSYRLNNRGEVRFINESEAGEKARYIWHFGDGQTYEGIHAQYTFIKNGIYHTCLSVTDEQGKYDSYCTDLYVENLPETRDIRGDVSLSNSIPDKAWVYLIRYDSILMTPFLIDSIRTDETGHFEFKNQPQGYYILRAALDIKSKEFSRYVPTFYGQTAGWNMAARHAINQESPQFSTLSIRLIPLHDLSPGVGRIDGNSPGERDLLLLYDEEGNPVGFTFADANGGYSFNNLPPGKYRIFNPSTGRFSSFTSVAPPPQPDQPARPATENSGGTNDIGNTGSMAVNTKDFILSPNPCRTYTTVKFDNPELSRARVSVININTNAEVFTFTVKNPQLKQEVTIDVQYWAPGLYYVTIDKGNGNIMSNKLLKSE